jgi:hypothetical protein
MMGNYAPGIVVMADSFIQRRYLNRHLILQRLNLIAIFHFLCLQNPLIKV